MVRNEGQPTLFLKPRKREEKQENVGNFSKITEIFLEKVRNLLTFTTFSCFSSRFLAFLHSRKSVKKESIAPRM